MNELFEEKMKVVLNLIRTNNSAEEALKITQAALNLSHARNTAAAFQAQEQTESKTIKKQGSSAT
jgi:hypothetical protein